MSLEAPKQAVLPDIDYAEHTLEMDVRFLFADQSRFKKDAAASEPEHLDDTQVNELLNKQ